MSHSLRRWLKDLLQYGRRSVQTPADAKAPLLWMADLPRLGQMWLGHIWFRIWLDLRNTPPRVVFAPREVFSPHVRMIRPTQLKPITPILRMRQTLASVGTWLGNGGPEHLFLRLRNLFAGGVLSALGVILFGALGIVGSILAGIAGLFGVSALGTILGIGVLGRATQHATRRTKAGLGLMRHGMTQGFEHAKKRIRSPREIAWTFATATGVVGLILLIVLQSTELAPVPKQALADESHTVARLTSELVAQAEPEADLFNGFPNPFGEPEPAPEQPATPPADDFGLDPFSEFPPQNDPEPAPQTPDLDVEIARGELPANIARFNLPDDNEQFVVQSMRPVAPVADFPPDDWLRAIPRDAINRPPVVPATYREMGDITPIVDSAPEPSDIADRFVPATRNVGVTIEKTQPARAETGSMIWYDLIVTNNSDESVAGVLVEERVAEPHRIADARPTAQFRDGVLTWNLDSLAAGEERRLSVAVYPMSNDPIDTTAAIRPVQTFSAVTLVQAPEPSRPEPLPTRPDPFDEPIPEPTPVADQPLRRVKIAMTTPLQVKNSANCLVKFTVTNTGEAPLTDVIIRGILPAELEHRYGVVVEADLGTLAPGQTKSAELRVTAAELGDAEVIAEVTTAEGVSTTVRGSFQVVDSFTTASTKPTRSLAPLALSTPRQIR